MKDKVTGIEIQLQEILPVGRIWFFKSHQFSHSYVITPRRVARALEAQRLFLAQLEKKVGQK